MDIKTTRKTRVNIATVLDKLYTDYVTKLQIIFENKSESTYRIEYIHIVYSLNLLYELDLINADELESMNVRAYDLMKMYENTANVERKEVKA